MEKNILDYLVAKFCTTINYPAYLREFFTFERYIFALRKLFIRIWNWNNFDPEIYKIYKFVSNGKEEHSITKFCTTTSHRRCISPRIFHPRTIYILRKLFTHFEIRIILIKSIHSQWRTSLTLASNFCTTKKTNHPASRIFHPRTTYIYFTRNLKFQQFWLMTLFFDFAFLSRKEEHSWLLAAEFCTTTGHALVHLREEEKRRRKKLLVSFLPSITCHHLGPIPWKIFFNTFLRHFSFLPYGVGGYKIAIPFNIRGRNIGGVWHFKRFLRWMILAKKKKKRKKERKMKYIDAFFGYLEYRTRYFPPPRESRKLWQIRFH